MTDEQSQAFADNAISEGRELRIIGINKNFHRTPYYITPKEDDITKEFKLGCEVEANGKKTLSTGEKIRQKTFPIAQQMFLDLDKDGIQKADGELTKQVPISHLQRVNTKNPKDAALLYLIMTYQEIVAVGKENINPSSHHFYIEDKKKEQKDKKSLIMLRKEVVEKVEKLSVSDYPAYVRYILGYKPGPDLDADSMLTELIVEADSNPKKVNEKLSSPGLKTSIFVSKCLNAGVVRHDRHNNVYKHEDTVIGTTFQEVCDFVNDDVNAVLKDSWAKSIK